MIFIYFPLLCSFSPFWKVCVTIIIDTFVYLLSILLFYLSFALKYIYPFRFKITYLCYMVNIHIGLGRYVPIHTPHSPYLVLYRMSYRRRTLSDQNPVHTILFCTMVTLSRLYPTSPRPRPPPLATTWVTVTPLAFRHYYRNPNLHPMGISPQRQSLSLIHHDSRSSTVCRCALSSCSWRSSKCNFSSWIIHFI